MKAVNQYARFMLYFAGIVFLAACTVAVIHLDGAIVRQDIMLTNTERNLNAKLDHLDEVTTKLNTATDQQTRYWAAITRDTRINLVNSNKAIKSLNHLIENTDAELNGKLLPKLEGSADGLNASVQDLDTSLKNLSEASRRASDLLGDPNLKQGIRNASEATLEAKGMASEGHRAAKEAADAFHETLHPKRPTMALRIIYWVLGRGFEASVTGATHGAVGH